MKNFYNNSPENTENSEIISEKSQTSRLLSKLKEKFLRILDIWEDTSERDTAILRQYQESLRRVNPENKQFSASSDYFDELLEKNSHK